MVLQDVTGQIQLYVDKKGLPEAVLENVKGWDIGDIVAARGPCTSPARAICTSRWTRPSLLTKSLRPLPDKFHGLTDIEARYRQRYVDLIMNDDSRRVFETRAGVISAMRQLLRGARLHGSRDADAAADPRWRHGAALHHPPQCAGHRHVPAYCTGAVSQAAGGRRLRAGLRDQPQLPQRGAVDPAQPRVHHDRVLSGLRRLSRADGPHRGHAARGRPVGCWAPPP